MSAAAIAADAPPASTSVSGDASQINTVTTTVSGPKFLRAIQDRGFSGSALMSYSVGAYETNEGEDRDAYSYTLGLGYKIDELYSVGLEASIYNNIGGADLLSQRQESEEDQLKLKTVAIKGSRVAWNLPRDFTLAPSLTVRTPVGRDTVDRQSLRVGIDPSVLVAIPVGNWTGLSKLSSSYTLSTFLNVHRYKTTTTGLSNRQYGYSHAVGAAYELPYKLSISGSMSYSAGWTYERNVVDKIGHQEKISWAFLDENGSVGIGHSNTGALFAYQGVNYDFDLLSEAQSSFFGELSLSF